jgi:hypothetical protein
MQKIRLLALATMVSVMVSVMAPMSFAAEEWVEKEGVVREIDLAQRTAIISGFRYYFGTSSGYQTPTIELLYYPTATFEMLTVGMKVQFHFTPEKPWRRILRLRQLPDDAWLDNDELPDAIPILGPKGT